MFVLEDLPYEFDALEPYIDAKTMALHYTKHHQTYVDNLNAAVEGTEYKNDKLELLLQKLDELPTEIRNKVRNNGGGHWNHTFFWGCMAAASGGMPGGKLHDMIVDSFGSFETMKQAFADAAKARFGSGWVWLVQQDEKLIVTSTPNQDSPIMEGVQPLLGLDVWEHAYYLKYQNRRPEYVENWWNVVDWSAVESHLS
jgi:Fe-Mn family superoxide dismutase